MPHDKPLDEETFFRELRERSPESVSAAKRVIGWVRARKRKGGGRWTAKEGFVHEFERLDRPPYHLFYLTVAGELKINVTRLSNRKKGKSQPQPLPPFDDKSKRDQLAEQFQTINRTPGPAKTKGVLKSNVARLEDDMLFNRFCSLVEWMTDEILRS